jgi:predicted phosphodiesterase
VRTALISDIHGNLDALQVVLADIDRRGVDEIVCLGDIVGYGPNPIECVDLVAERCAWSLMGNHDFAVLYEPTNFNVVAKDAAHWTRDVLEEAVEQDPASGNRRLDFLNRIKTRQLHEKLYTCVHGSVRKPINEYLFDEDLRDDPAKVRRIFEMIDQRCLVGHTHVPGVFIHTEEDGPDFMRPSSLGHEDPDDPALIGVHVFDPDEKAIVNPGSVGQPRDQDDRASYAILETGDDAPHRVNFYRLEYDITAVAEKIYAIDRLDDWLGDRLFQGR